MAGTLSFLATLLVSTLFLLQILELVVGGATLLMTTNSDTAMDVEYNPGKKLNSHDATVSSEVKEEASIVMDVGDGGSLEVEGSSTCLHELEDGFCTNPNLTATEDAQFEDAQFEDVGETEEEGRVVFGDNQCQLYLFDSAKIGRGRGIFAGVDFAVDETLEVGPSLQFEEAIGAYWMSRNYVYGGENDTQTLVFGASSIFNHDNVLRNAHHFWVHNTIASFSDQAEPHSTSTMVRYAAYTAIKAGQEIFTSYGSNEWFNSREIPIIEHPTSDKDPVNTPNDNYVDIDTLRAEAHCLSDVFVGESQIPLAGKGLFAARSFAEGEFVSISPAIVLPKDEVFEATKNSNMVLVNYMITDPCSDIALLPLGLAAMINHEDPAHVNLEMSLFDPQGLGHLTERLATISETDLLSMKYAPLDIVYKSIRTIQAGEELTVSYGSSWIYRWASYLSHRIIAKDYNDEAPKFVLPISAPENFFPDHFYDASCLEHAS